MFNGTELHRIYLDIPSARRRWSDLLALVSLTPDEDPDYTVGVSDNEGNLIGTASLHADIIKYVAIHPDHRGESVANILLSDIIGHAADLGISSLSIFTKPDYVQVFSDLSFRLVGRCESSALLENSAAGITAYKAYLSSVRASVSKNPVLGADSTCGVIVMNANPPTLGHLHLVREAASRVGKLFVIPLADNDKTEFSYAARRRALVNATAHIPNVTVLEGSRYCISSSTFPSYFIKELTERADSHILLDLDIFANHIAPALGASVRFVGEEPTDPLTARYNELMKRILPARGIDVVEIPRLADSCGCPVSASRVRSALSGSRIAAAAELLPDASIPALLARCAALALKRELDLTPKPGLVDCRDNGAHKDMDHRLMSESIRTLEPVFEEIARISMSESLPDAAMLQPAGLSGERLMLEATGGVNTHKGALFSIGLAVSAVAYLIYNARLCGNQAGIADILSPDSISSVISVIAQTFSRPDGTHGASVRNLHHVSTALDMAVGGYAPVFGSWRRISDPYRRLLLIMSELEDSNIYHRGGREGADFIRKRSAELLSLHADDASAEALTDALGRFNAECVGRWLSPGGAADMLALSFFIDIVTDSKF